MRAARFIPEWEDTPPDYHWLKYADKTSEEFKRRMRIWGRPWFIAMWKEMEADPTILKEGLGPEPPPDPTSLP
jgi:hypothetical protein